MVRPPQVKGVINMSIVKIQNVAFALAGALLFASVFVGAAVGPVVSIA
jgi:hypothetical protein